MQPWAEKFYKSKAWQKCRESVLKRDNYLCVDCDAKGKLMFAEEVHHIVELTPENINDPSVTLNMDNLVSLCRSCHRARHGARKWRYLVDEFGHVTITE